MKATPTAQESHEAALASYVRQTVFGNARTDIGTLAALVTAAPGRHVLAPDEWWNVALLLAYGVRDGD